jgi:D-alanyl-lipoteichoic acid acyltransferase DltB (MBOAT superfamily)
MLPQMKHDHRFSYERTLSGVTLILSGYVRKIVVADSLAPLVDVRFSVPEAHSALSLLLGVYFYAFQIYCDFSGYSSIAIGLARIFGFDFGINFDRPYFSRSFSEFWTRWHISLSSWLRDYLYIPLGGNRDGAFATYRNLMLTMVLGGLWHGANWTFVAWGALHGIYLTVQRMLGPYYERIRRLLRIPAFLSDLFLVVVVFHLTCLSWVFFRAQSFHRAWQILRKIGAAHDMTFASVDQKFLVLKCLMLIAVLLVFEAATFLPKLRRPILAPAEGEPVVVSAHAHAVSPWRRLAFSAACIWAVLLFGTFSGNSFIYFQF